MALHPQPARLDHFAAVTPERWAACPNWVKFEMEDRASEGGDNEGLVFFAQYELYALIVNAYSSLDSGTLIPGVTYHSALFHALPRGHFQSPAPSPSPFPSSARAYSLSHTYRPFPLLPLSQDYSPQAVQHALDSLTFLVTIRLKHEPGAQWERQARVNKFVKEIDEARRDWEHAWGCYSVERRRALSRSLWNSFVLVLQGSKIPNSNHIFVTAAVPTTMTGGARPFSLPAGARDLERVAVRVDDSDAAFHQTLTLVLQHVDDHFPHARTWKWPPTESMAHDYGAECLRHLERLGGMGALQEDERRRLLVELFMVYHNLSSCKTDKMPSPDQVFECLARMPSIPAPQPITLSKPPSHPPHSNAVHRHFSTPSGDAPPVFTAHSLGRHGHLSGPDAAIGLRTAKRIKVTPEDWAARAARRARRAY